MPDVVRRNSRVSTYAENMLMSTPMINANANPLMIEVPNQKSRKGDYHTG